MNIRICVDEQVCLRAWRYKYLDVERAAERNLRNEEISSLYPLDPRSVVIILENLFSSVSHVAVSKVQFMDTEVPLSSLSKF